MAPAESPVEPPLPERLEQSAINAAFAEHIDDVRACIIEEIGRNPRLAQVRIAFIVEGDGSGHAFSFAPNTQEFVDCLYPKVREYRFARFRRPRQLARYIVSVQAEERPPREQPPALAADAPFWARAAAGTRYEVEPESEPWWHTNQPIAPTTEARDSSASHGRPTTEVPPAAAATSSPAFTPDAGAERTQPETTEMPTRQPQAPTAPEPEPEDPWWIPTQRSTK